MKLSEIKENAVRTVEWAQGGGKNLSPFEASCHRMAQTILALVEVAEAAMHMLNSYDDAGADAYGVDTRICQQLEAALAKLEAP